jgi:glycosyltransferase involved in cell wall biosynthesis
MKIGCITTSIVPSKTANSIQAVKVCHALKQCGQDVQLWVPEFERAQWPQIAEIYGISEQFDITWLPFNKKLKQYDFSYLSVRKTIDWGADVIYTWALQAAFIGNVFGKPVAMEFHDFPMGFMGPKIFRMFMRLPAQKLIMTTTRALANGIEEKYGLTFKDADLQIAPNGTDPDRYRGLPLPSVARTQLGLPDGFTVGYTGHFYPGRGMDLLTAIAKALPEVQFLWVGGMDKHIAPWKETLAAEGIKNVTITGFIPNHHLPLYQAAADVLVMPYAQKIEGSSGGNIAPVINPMKMFDYLSVGRPIIASNIPVFHEVLTPDLAVFCDPDDAAEWADVIRKLSQDPSLCQTMRKAALEKAQHYSWKNRAEKSITMLEAKIGTIHE